MKKYFQWFLILLIVSPLSYVLGSGTSVTPGTPNAFKPVNTNPVVVDKTPYTWNTAPIVTDGTGTGTISAGATQTTVSDIGATSNASGFISNVTDLSQIPPSFIKGSGVLGSSLGNLLFHNPTYSQIKIQNFVNLNPNSATLLRIQVTLATSQTLDPTNPLGITIAGTPQDGGAAVTSTLLAAGEVGTSNTQYWEDWLLAPSPLDETINIDPNVFNAPNTQFTSVVIDTFIIDLPNVVVEVPEPTSYLILGSFLSLGLWLGKIRTIKRISL